MYLIILILVLPRPYIHVYTVSIININITKLDQIFLVDAYLIEQFNIGDVIFLQLELEIVLAIPASNELKIQFSNTMVTVLFILFKI